MIAKFGRRRQYLPQRLDVFVSLEERLTGLGLQKAAVDDTLQTFVGMTVEDASVLVVGVWTPSFADGFESGDASAWSAVVP